MGAPSLMQQCGRAPICLFRAVEVYAQLARARVLEGEVEMTVNYGLEPDEIARGYVLTCQAHPKSKKVTVSFDH